MLSHFFPTTYHLVDEKELKVGRIILFVNLENHRCKS